MAKALFGDAYDESLHAQRDRLWHREKELEAEVERLRDRERELEAALRELARYADDAIGTAHGTLRASMVRDIALAAVSAETEDDDE